MEYPTVAVAQASCVVGQVGANLERVLELCAEASHRGASLVVFPECVLTGYVLDSRDDVLAAAITDQDPAFERLFDLAERLQIHIVVGYLERRGHRVFNVARIIGPRRVDHRYEKRHLPYLGADRFVDIGASGKPPAKVPPAVFDTAVGRIGIAICYEIRFPEAIRTLALAGADIVVLPTAWPVASSQLAEQFAPVRAAENFVYLLVADRKDEENGTQFLGGSQILDPSGRLLAQAVTTDQVIVAEVDLARSRDKRIVFDEGAFEVSPWVDRRPDTYWNDVATVPSPDQADGSGRDVPARTRR